MVPLQQHLPAVYQQHPEIARFPAQSQPQRPIQKSQTPTSAPIQSSLQALRHIPQQTFVFRPPITVPSGSAGSPAKHTQEENVKPMSKPVFNQSISIPPPANLGLSGSPMKKAAPSLFDTSAPASLFQKPSLMYSTFPSPYSGEKENNTSSTLPAELPQIKVKKRVLQDAALIKEKNNDHNKGSSSPYTGPIPDPADMPEIHDNGKKPSISYANLIGMAILRAPERRLTLAQIYKWISDNFSHYRASDGGWQNSIRHNLSLNKAFVKQERGKDDPGKGSYWIVSPGSEYLFLKQRTRRPSTSGTTSKQPKLPKQVKKETSLHIHEDDTADKLLPATRPVVHTDDFPVVSSDATIDEATLEEDAQNYTSDVNLESILNPPVEDDLLASPQYAAFLPESSPLQMMHSSPPITRRAGTPPATVTMLPSYSLKRKASIVDLDDSGYFSSLDSSVIRTSAGMEPPRKIKRGRAEEEIARLRQTAAFDSPIPKISVQSPEQSETSSPLRQYDQRREGMMLPPLTPLTTLKRPTKAPPSVSPNTNLRLHRDMIRNLVGSPSREIELMRDDVFVDNFDFNTGIFDADFDPFAQPGENYFDSAFFQSPIKRSSPKRPEIGHRRTQSSSGTTPTLSILDDGFLFGASNSSVDVVEVLKKGALKIRSVSSVGLSERPSLARTQTSTF